MDNLEFSISLSLSLFLCNILEPWFINHIKVDSLVEEDRKNPEVPIHLTPFPAPI